MTSVWDSKLGGVKTKGGRQAGLENRLSPLKWRRRRKDLVMKLNPSARKDKKILNKLYIINIKKVLI